MGTPTRFNNGVTNVTKQDPLGMYLANAPMLVHSYFNDFDTYAAGDWTVTVIGTGSNALVAGEPGGALASTNSAADNDGVQYQLTAATFVPVAGKRAWFKARFKVSDATQSDLLIGLAALDTTLLGATGGDGVTDGIFFAKDDGSTSLYVSCQKNTTTGQTQATGIATLANDTYLTVAWYFDGQSEVAYWVNDVQQGHLDGTSTYLPDTPLSLSVALLNGEAVAKVLTVDYLFAAVER